MSKIGDGTILLTGATGYVGVLLASALLSRKHNNIVAPIRSQHSRDDLIARIKLEIAAAGLTTEIDFSRLITVTLPPINEIESLITTLDKLEVQEIIHCAGSVDYFDSAKLKEVNIDMTARLIALGKQLQIKRFTFISTAFSSGFIEGLVPEMLHHSAPVDPTEYTRSKREAEALVANSSLPFLIVRPSVIIGDSRNGHYSGKAYGLYQYMTAYEKFLCDRYRAELHFIAPLVKLQVIHQDAFQAAFLKAFHDLADDSIIQLVSRNETLPTVREVTHIWNVMFSRPRVVTYYNNLDEVPSAGLDRRMRMWLEFTAVNGEIAAHPWHFQTTALDRLRAEGLNFADATIDSVSICQQHFIAKSARLQAFAAKIEQDLGATRQAVEVRSPQSQLTLSAIP